MTMRKGFIFNDELCVNCKACSAACVLEHGWSVTPRIIFSYNSEAIRQLPVINLSLACNHCEDAVCLTGCPTQALNRDESTGAVVADANKCIGCRYCQWNCPYDAPKFDPVNKTIIKCHLCYEDLPARNGPACSSGCPTGALSYAEIKNNKDSSLYAWFPDKDLDPSIKFIAAGSPMPLKIVPESLLNEVKVPPEHSPVKIASELSLVIFSWLSTLSVAIMFTSLLKGTFPLKWIFIPVLSLAGIASFFHLGQKRRSWRALLNLKTSALSKEIAGLIIYGLFAIAALFTGIPVFLILASITGLIYLNLIDNVYSFTKSKSLIFHSGQTLISALLISSYMSGSVLPFAFIALIKLFISINLLIKTDRSFFELRFFRISLLIITGMSLILNGTYSGLPILVLFLAGELLDRFLFYIDFTPLNINLLIREHQNSERNEKEKS